MNYCLQFTDEAEAINTLFTTIGEEVMPNYANIDTIGVIQKPTGELDAEGNPLITPLAGWHVNILTVAGEDDAALVPFIVYPVTPYRIWAGV